MFLWTLVGHNLTEAEVLSGCNDDLAQIMRQTEPYLTGYRAFACRIIEVVRLISVFDLENELVPTGRVWLGRRTRSLSVCWKGSYEAPDPDVSYRFDKRVRAAQRDLGGGGLIGRPQPRTARLPRSPGPRAGGRGVRDDRTHAT
jgi:hypothetical protein